MTLPSSPLGAGDFARLEALFAALAPLDGTARANAIAEECASLPDLQRELESLLSAHDRLAASGDPDDDPRVADVRVGAYRLVEKIGEGGMGDVFRAERADGVFEQQVAVKLTRSTIGDSDLRRRFVIERQILASLNHENIVRLLDGGTTATGQAFLIMEHVNGVPLTEHCRVRRLGLEDRLKLFTAVCHAVQYAHQHGVVHRDLKPANILVTTDHIPKVLDFGIAKLLEGQGGTGLTTTGVIPGPLTPNYASPEQLRGLSVTTASDVYALGVVLYEITSGVRPYETEGLPLEQMIDVVLRQQPVRPSSATGGNDGERPYGRSRLKGDLDAIVLRAMSKEPADRYASAAELAADLTRFLDGHPVLARTSSTGYVLRRIAGRHKPLVAVSALAIVAIVAASGVALWQSQVARREQARAEQRFNEVRRLANAVIFKIHDAVRPLPGSTPVRRVIVDEAIGYLERLEAESEHDEALILELAAAHRRVGSILGDVGDANLGDRAGATRQYERARQLVLPMATPSAPYDVVLAMVDADLQLSVLSVASGDQAQAVAHAQDAVAYASSYWQGQPAERRGAELQARAYFGLATAVPQSESMPIWYKTLDFYEKLLAVLPDDASTQRNVALVGKYIGGALERLEPAKALPYYARSLELDERRLKSSPDDTRVQFDAAISYSNVASTAELLGDADTAARFFDRSLTLRRRLAEGDPTNMQVRARLAFLLSRIGRFHLERSPVESIRFSREAITVIASSNGAMVDLANRHIVARSWYQIGLSEARLKARTRSCEAYRQSHKTYTTITKGFNSEEQEIANSVAMHAAACGPAGE